MVVELIKEKEVWDNFVDRSPYGLIFHKWDYLKITERHTGYKLLLYGIYKGDKLIGIFPLFYKKIKGLKTVFSPPPQTGIPYLGFVMNKEYNTLKQNKKENYLNIIADEINDEIKKFSPNYISISIVPEVLDIRPFKWNNYQVNIGFTYFLDLNRTLDDIWNDFKKNLRSKIKRAEELNLKVLESDDLSILYDLLKQRYEEQGMNFPIVSRNYLEDLLKAYPKNLGLYYLYDNNEVIGGRMTQEYKRFLLWMGNPKIKNYICGSDYMNWKMIQRAKTRGYKEFEIWGAGVKNLCQFKSKFNPSLAICFTIHKKDALGKTAEWVYLNFIKKSWV
jgi:hypothetical protein